MIEYRAFRNSDPPEMAQVWRACAPARGLAQPISADLLEQLVFAKPYFDNRGLILARHEGVPLGFVHAGFGPSEDRRTLSFERGIVCLLLVRPHEAQGEIAAELLTRAEEYLRERGAEAFYGGGIPETQPFYLGLYGGSALPGVLASDQRLRTLFETTGYSDVGRRKVMHRDLLNFRPPIDRVLMQVRRNTKLEIIEDPPALDWWDACTYGGFDRTLCQLLPRSGGTPLARVMAWHMEPLSSSWGVQSVGLTHLQVNADKRRGGLATYMLGELFKQLQTQGVAIAEIQHDAGDAASAALCAKLGFQEVDQGVTFRKAARSEISADEIESLKITEAWRE